MKKIQLTKEKILKLLEDNRDQINKYGVKKIGLFGSFLRGNQNKESDIDILVVFHRPTFDNYMELKFFLEKLFHRKVDLILEDALKPSIKHVKEEAIYA